MVKHVVMWKLKNEAEGHSMETNRITAKEKLESLPALISQIESLEVGINLNSSEAAFDLVLITTHRSMDDLSGYVAHEAHQYVAKFIAKIVSERKVVDFEF
ncbi:MAG: Dabb family protein [Cyclobacteriaceae bacterium]|nr:Dabb family protein [Cyclobacteriaceae bacterium]